VARRPHVVHYGGIVATETVQRDDQPLGPALDNARMSPLHVRFWLLAGLGILLDGFDFFIIGVAIPLISRDLGASAAERGLISAAAIVGAVFGAGLLGSSGSICGCSSPSRWCASSRGTSGR
jgi:hypothetical protein